MLRALIVGCLVYISVQLLCSQTFVKYNLTKSHLEYSYLPLEMLFGHKILAFKYLPSNLHNTISLQ